MLKDKFKDLVMKEKGSKKKIENIVVFIVILIITVIAINTIWSGDNSKDNKESTQQEITKQLAVTEHKDVQTSSEDTTTIEKRIEEILSNIDGVGKVKVLITYSESSEVVAMFNENNKNSTIEEKDSGGGTRTTTQTDVQKDIVYKEENGEKVPVTRKSNKA